MGEIKSGMPLNEGLSQCVDLRGMDIFCFVFVVVVVVLCGSCTTWSTLTVIY